MASFLGSRKPDFRAGREALVYNGDGYWKVSNLSLNTKLCERERIILDRIPVGSTVFIVGCGKSQLTPALVAKGCKVTISDIAPAIVEFFLKKGIPGFILDLENMNETSLVGNYDIVVASEVLEHVRNPEHAVEILSKHTRRFLFSLPNSAFYRYRLHLMFGGRFFRQWKEHPAEHLRYWSYIDFLDWLSAMDLRTRSVIPANGLSIKGGIGTFMQHLWPNLFAHQIVYDCDVIDEH
jgi:2-polyprenyl-3-methyl-5-hydroxy-6-metoxy-1,4-benzoquinol methylase